MLRLLTAAIGSPLLLATLFLAPSWAWFAFLLLAILVASVELASMMRTRLAGSPLRALPALVAGFALLVYTAAATSFWTSGALSGLFGGQAPSIELVGLWVLAAALLSTVVAAAVVLFGRTPTDEVLPTLGLFAFAPPYLVLPVIALCHLQQVDPWLVVLVLAVVWLGDTAAYYVGRAVGRHKMAPVVSPNKSWEGAAASSVTALIAGAVWCWIVPGAIDWRVLLLALAANAVGQIGDLFESLLKRGAGVKDSGSLLPGHGGILDRVDGILFAAPVTWLAVLWIGTEAFAR